MSENTFVYVIYINASAEQVWDALTQGDFTQQYWGGRRIESDWKVGSPVKHVRSDGSDDFLGEILEVDHPRTLAYSWRASAERATRVTFTLQYQEPNTRLMLTHEGLPEDAKQRAQTVEGWTAILSNLKTLMERGEPMSFPWWRG